MSSRSLKNAYDLWDEANKTLSRRYPRTSERTCAERVLYEYLSDTLEFRVMRSVWIGKHCIDLYLPQLKIAIEVNGTIHNRGFKIVKDFRKDEFLMGYLDISVFEVQNKDVHYWKERLSRIMQQQKAIPIAEEQKLINRILAETIPAHEETKSLFLSLSERY